MIVPQTKELIIKKNELLNMLEKAEKEDKEIIEQELKSVMEEINRINKESLAVKEEPKVEIKATPTQIKPRSKKEKEEFIEQCAEVIKQVQPPVVVEIKQTEQLKKIVEANAPYTYNLLTLEPVKTKATEVNIKKKFHDTSVQKLIFEIVFKKECNNYLELLMKVQNITGKSFFSTTTSINFFLWSVKKGLFEHIKYEDIKHFRE